MGEMISNEESITSMQGGMRVCACVRADKERARSLSTQFCGYERVCVLCARARAGFLSRLRRRAKLYPPS